MSEQAKAQRFVALCMLGVVLFNYPVLALFNVTGTLLGVPVLYAYIFLAWAALIALMALVAHRYQRPDLAGSRARMLAVKTLA